MATVAQIEANRANAQHSTGPRTPEGKAQSSANSRKDGLTAATLHIPDRDRAEFDAFQSSLTEAILPVGPLELEYFQRLLTSGWILRRARSLEVQLLFGHDPIYNADDARNLQKIARYRRDLERTYDRALKELRLLQSQRAANTTQQPPAVLATPPQPAPTAARNEPNLPPPVPQAKPGSAAAPTPAPSPRLRSA